MSGPPVKIREAQAVELSQRTSHAEKVNWQFPAFSGAAKSGQLWIQVSPFFSRAATHRGMQETQEIGCDHGTLAVSNHNDFFIALRIGVILPVADISEKRDVPATDAGLGIVVQRMFPEPVVYIQQQVECWAKAKGEFFQ